ncbi:MerR family transcriptional regulator [Clostridium sp. MSJ-4]|uniref:MerR family transcriptional regulator n=1 Tax=Clostridium simiarum TaxID=2841506 RepID=A0ABS6F0M6_9CLOT|nr:MerR family transcriptional regulator [Clostridium simiarum]
MEKLTIGKMAKLNNISEQALRLYDKIGLLKPYYVDESTGYRYYNIKQCARLDMIQYMKEFGMNLKQIKEHLDNNNVQLIQEVLECQKKILDENILALTQKKNAITKSIEDYKRYTSSPKEGVVLIEYIPERRIYCYDCGVNIYNNGIENYEYMLRELKNHILLHKLPMVYFCNVGSILRKNRLVMEDFYSTEIFLFIAPEFQPKEGIEVIQSGTFACIYFHDFYEEKNYAKKLLEHIENQGYKIVGDYICEVIAELPVFSNNERNLFIKLQIPIDFK